MTVIARIDRARFGRPTTACSQRRQQDRRSDRHHENTVSAIRIPVTANDCEQIPRQFAEVRK